MLRVSSVSATARCSGPRGTVLRRLESMAPDLLRFEEQAADGSRTVVVCRFDGGWQVDGALARPLESIVCTELRLLAVHLLVLRYDLLLSGLEVGVEVGFAGESCLPLSGRDPSGHQLTVLVGERALPVGFRLETTADQRGPLIGDLSDWRQVGPVLLPHYATFTTDGELWRCTFSSVALNDVEPSRFRIPSVDSR